MSIYNYHRRLLSPQVWSADELTLRNRVKNSIRDQMRMRFPNASAHFLIGDLAGHYYDDTSAFDIIILANKPLLKEYRKEASIASGFLLPSTSYPVYFHIFDTGVSPEALTDKFGSMFDLDKQVWIGRRDTGLTEFIRPEALLQHIRWRLYKVKELLDPYPYDWKVLEAALPYVSTKDREWLIEQLVKARAVLRNNVNKLLEYYPDREVWKATDQLQSLFEEEADFEDIEKFAEQSRIPEKIIQAVYNAFRYEDVLDVVESGHERLVRDETSNAMQHGVSMQLLVGQTHHSGSDSKMTLYRSKQINGFAAMTLEGATAALPEAQATLRIAGLNVDSVGKNSIMLRDVREDDLPNIQAIAKSFNLQISGKFGPKTFVVREATTQKKAFKLNLQPELWYFAEGLEETYPFVVVRDVRMEKTGSNGDEDQILDLELYGVGHTLPVKQTVSSREAAKYGLRPATEDDFAAADMILPVSEESVLQIPTPSHGIPTDVPPVKEKPTTNTTSNPSPIA